MGASMVGTVLTASLQDRRDTERAGIQQKERQPNGKSEAERLALSNRKSSHDRWSRLEQRLHRKVLGKAEHITRLLFQVAVEIPRHRQLGDEVGLREIPEVEHDAR